MKNIPSLASFSLSTDSLSLLKLLFLTTFPINKKHINTSYFHLLDSSITINKSALAAHMFYLNSNIHDWNDQKEKQRSPLLRSDNILPALDTNLGTKHMLVEGVAMESHLFLVNNKKYL